jgi:hypothetical protein
LKGICGQRNAISSIFPPHTRIVEVDDDIEGILIHDVSSSGSREPKLVPSSSVSALLDAAWRLAGKVRCNLWGVSASPLFLQHTVSVCVLKCVGQLQGYVNDRSLRLTVAVSGDWERCLEFSRRGQRCCRLNFLTPETKNRAQGGCSSAFAKDFEKINGAYWHPRAVEEKNAAESLSAKYPEYVTVKAREPTMKKFVWNEEAVEYHQKGQELLMKRSTREASLVHHYPLGTLAQHAAEFRSGFPRLLAFTEPCDLRQKTLSGAPRP